MNRFEHNVPYTLSGQNEDATIDGVYTDGVYIVARHAIGNCKRFDFRLTVRREDREPIRSWRLLQNIKNEVAGADRIAIEVYPPESEVTDTANIYHLWVYKEGCGPGVRLTAPK